MTLHPKDETLQDWFDNSPDTEKYIGIYRQGYGAGKPKEIFKGVISNLTERYDADGVLEVTATFNVVFVSRGTI